MSTIAICIYKAHTKTQDASQERVEYEDYHTYAEVGDLRDGGALYGHPTIEERELMEREGSIANPGGVQVGGTGV